jgi:hypothetical protein
MSRRHHGNRPHRSNGPSGPYDPSRSARDAPAAAEPRDRSVRPAAPPALGESRVVPDGHAADPAASEPWPEVARAAPDPARRSEPQLVRAVEAARSPEVARSPEPARRGPDGSNGAELASCTAPQLRRFIKSRPYVPMHELRRRFGINGTEDDVSAIDLGDRHRVFVGLPPREGSLLGELLRGGDIGYELSLDPRTPIVIGLYPMRPVARS